MENLLIQSVADVSNMRMEALSPVAPTPAAGHPPAALVPIMHLLSRAGHALAIDHDEAHECLQKAVALLQARRKANDAGSPGGSRCRLAPWQVTRVAAFVRENIDGRMGIDQLAGTVGLSASHFSRAFRSTVGVTPHTYVMRCRVERAQEMILDTDAPLSEIALDCGLADQAHLTKLFRRVVGTSPGAWRRRRRSERTIQGA